MNNNMNNFNRNNSFNPGMGNMGGGFNAPMGGFPGNPMGGNFGGFNNRGGMMGGMRGGPGMRGRGGMNNMMGGMPMGGMPMGGMAGGMGGMPMNMSQMMPSKLHSFMSYSRNMPSTCIPLLLDCTPEPILAKTLKL
jgi:hypothetical protein